MVRDRKLFPLICLTLLAGISLTAIPLPVAKNAVAQTFRKRKYDFETVIQFRLQKPGTESIFATQNRILQQLQATKPTKPAAIRSRESNLKRTYRRIDALFEPSQLDNADIVNGYIIEEKSDRNIYLNFTPEGCQRFADLTKKIAGSPRRLGVFYRGKFLSALTIGSQHSKTGITEGRAVIKVNLDKKEAVRLELLLLRNYLISPTGRYQYLVNAGRDKAEEQDFEGAIRDFDEAIQLDSRKILAYLARGEVKNTLGKWQEAIADFQRVLATQPRNVDAYRGIGKAREGLKDYTSAAAAYEAIIQADPDTITYFYSPLLKNYLLLSKKAEAVKLTETRSKRFYGRSNNNLQRDVTSNWSKAIVLIHFQDYQAAIEPLNKAIALMPNFTPAYVYRGLAYNKLGNRQAAIKDWQKVISIKLEDTLTEDIKTRAPDDPLFEFNYNDALGYARFFRGLAYYYLENWESAKEDLDKAIALSAPNANAQQLRSLVRQKLKDEAGAEKDAREAARFFTGSGEIALPL